MKNWADTLIKKAFEVHEAIDVSQFISHKHVCVDDKDVQYGFRHERKNNKQRASIAPPKERKKSKSGVVGVSDCGKKNGITYWLAKIQRDGVLTSLYCGPDFNEAVRCRKKAEEERGPAIYKRNKLFDLPAGVLCSIQQGKPHFVASGTKNGVHTYVYTGRCLEHAIAARKKWEEDNGFKDMNGRKCISPRKLQKGSLSGFVGVTKTKQGKWLAKAQKAGVLYILYRGYSKKGAVCARKRWEKDGTFDPELNINDKRPRVSSVYKLFRFRKKLTSRQVVEKLQKKQDNVAGELLRLYKNGFLYRERVVLNGKSQYIYRRKD